MQTIEVRGDSATVRLTAQELEILSNAIGETLGSVREREFSAKLGVCRQQVESLRRMIAYAIDSIQSGQE